jgi:hypothetical protein
MPPYLIEHGNTYTVSMPEYKQTGQCPVPGCETTIKDKHRMRRHFMFRHYYDMIIILEEGQLPRCHSCGMFCTPFSTCRKTFAICTMQRRSETQQTQKNELNMHPSFPTNLSHLRSTHRNSHEIQVSWTHLNIAR